MEGIAVQLSITRTLAQEICTLYCVAALERVPALQFSVDIRCTEGGLNFRLFTAMHSCRKILFLLLYVTSMILYIVYKLSVEPDIGDKQVVFFDQTFV